MIAMDLAKMIEEQHKGEVKTHRVGGTREANMGWAKIGTSMGQLGIHGRPHGVGWAQKGNGLNNGLGSQGVVRSTMPSFQGNSQGSRDTVGVNSVASNRLIHEGNNDNRGNKGSIVRAGRNLSYHEYVDKREKGFCFRCDQPYTPLHKCAVKSLRVTILAEDELPEVNEGDNTNEVIEEESSGIQHTIEIGTAPVFNWGNH